MFRSLLCIAILAAASLPVYSLQATVANPEARGGVEILTKLTAEQSRIMDDNHVMRKITAKTYGTWLANIPDEAKSPTFKKGSVAIEFTLYPDGSVKNMRLAKVSGDVNMDRAAWEAITHAANYTAFPPTLDLPELKLRFRFVYNGDDATVTQPPAP